MKIAKVELAILVSICCTSGILAGRWIERNHTPACPPTKLDLAPGRAECAKYGQGYQLIIQDERDVQWRCVP